MARFSANLGFLWPDRPLLARIDAAARAGFRAVEVHWPYDVPAADVKAACAGHGLTMLGLNTVRGERPGDFGLAAVPGRELEFLAALEQSVAYCRAAGFNAIHVMAGVVPAGQADAAAELFVKHVTLAADRAAGAGLTILLEPLNQRDAPGYFYASIERADDIITAVARPNVKIMFDCYHVGVMQGDVIKRLERFLPRIGHVQIAAVPSRAEPDEGEIAYAAVLAALDRFGYAGWVGCEYKPRADTDAGLAWVKRLGVRL